MAIPRKISHTFGRFDTLVLTSVLWFLGKYVRYAFLPLFDRIAGVYGISTAVLGTAYTGLMIAYAVMQFPSGLLADRFGATTVITGGASLAAVGALVLAVDSPFSILLAAMIVIGIGTGTLKTVGVRLLSGVYPSQTGRALGIFDTFGTFGGVIAPAVVVLTVSLPGVVGASWRTAFLCAGIVGIGTLALFVSRVSTPEGGPAETASTAQGQGTLRAYLSLFQEWQFTLFVLVTVLFSFAYNGIVAFLPLYLSQAAGLESATASLLYSVLFVASLVQLVTGESSDRVGALPIMILTLGLATAGMTAIVLLTDVGTVFLFGGAVVCLGLGAHGYRPVRGVYLMSVIPESVAGGGLGAVRTLLMAAGALSPAVVGIVSTTVSFPAAFWILTAMLILATVLTIVLWVLGNR